MRRLIKSIIPMLSHSQDRQFENKKVSYWLEKLFNQTREMQDSSPKQISPSIKTIQSSEEKGLDQAVKDHADKAEKNRQSVEDMVSNSNRILLRVSSIFPWDLFPSSIIAEETRLTIIHRQFYSSQLYSVDIKNISNIFINTGILFAQLVIVSNTFAQNQIIINRLWKRDAILMRRVIEGLRMFVTKDIDTTSYSVKELVGKLEELSTTRIVL